MCEVVEGDITQLQDKLGNFVEGNTQIAVVKRELPRQVLIITYTSHEYYGCFVELHCDLYIVYNQM